MCCGSHNRALSPLSLRHLKQHKAARHEYALLPTSPSLIAPMASALDAERAERKVWIVRVPPYVAQRWHAAIARSASADVDDEAGAEVLGQVSIEQGMATTLRVPGDAQGGEGVTTLYMNGNRDTTDTAVLSYEQTAAGGITAAKADGVVHKRYDAGPVKIADAVLQDPAAQRGLLPADIKQQAAQRQRDAAALQAQVDAAYLQSSRKRLAAAAKPAAGSRKVVLIEDVRTAQKLEGAQTISLWSQRRDAKQRPVVTREEKRRVRMSRDELEAELFKAFEKQAHWHFVALQKELDQPSAFLKEVLNELATQVKRGPHKDLWELKKHLAPAAPQ